jgi:signal transduction histidine kinase
LAKAAIPERLEVSHKVEADAKKLIADPDLLKRILANLVNNAVQAMPKGGKLTLNASRERGDVVITVEDTGEGIPIEVRPKLFTPLFTTKSRGQGFGLAVVKRMTEAMRGTVAFESEIGKGTKFTLRFPDRR